MTRRSTHDGNDSAISSNRAGKKPGRSVKARAVHEVGQLAIMFLYLFVLFGLFSIHESIVLEQHHIGFTYYGFALVNALVLAKVMLVAEDLHLGRRFEDSPLIYPVVFKSILFAVLFICFHVVEHVIVGLWRGQPILGSIPELGGGGIKGVFSVGIILSFALIPFFAFRELSRVLGSDVLQKLLFRRGSVRVAIDLVAQEKRRG
jgi:hypothetical protein